MKNQKTKKEIMEERRNMIKELIRKEREYRDIEKKIKEAKLQKEVNKLIEELERSTDNELYKDYPTNNNWGTIHHYEKKKMEQ